ncbi:MAG: LuxR family transcriptional regulator [Pseudomonadota bacterium]
MSERLNTILEKLSKLPDLGSFGDIIDCVRGTYDVDHVYYYAISLGLDTRDLGDRKIRELPEVDGVLQHRGRQLAAMSYSPEWIARYMEARFFEFDPVLQGASASFDPIDWNELDWESNDARQFLHEAEDFGVGNQGYTIPVRGPGGQLAIFTINKHCDQLSWEKLLAAFRTDFMLLAHFTHQRVLKLAGLEHMHPTRPLSNRERDAMRLIADGLSRGRASERLGISENTFRVYIDSARHKLGALNIPHAIALAAHRGIIPPT